MILLDHCVPRPLRRIFVGHQVKTAQEMGWTDLSNGDLMRAAATDGFDVFITIDQGVRFQQNLQSLPIAVLLIRTASSDIDSLVALATEILAALERFRGLALDASTPRPLVTAP